MLKKYFYYLYCTTKQIIKNFNFLKLICFEEVREKSSHYGLNMLGYTRATRLKTIRCDSVN